MMTSTTVYYNNIKEVINLRIREAQKNISIAMCYFTNKEIINLLVNKSFSGVNVELIVDDNATLKKKIFRYAAELGCKIYVTNKSKIMHHKICLIDDQTYITGSYNFTMNAENRNKENIVVINNMAQDQLIKVKKELDDLKSYAERELIGVGLSKKNPFLTPLIRARKELWAGKNPTPLFLLKKHPNLKWITNYTWHPFQKKEFKLVDIYDAKNNIESLIITNPNLLWWLNYNDIAIKTKCNHCDEKLIASWYNIHFIPFEKCQHCNKNYTVKTDNIA